MQVHTIHGMELDVENTNLAMVMCIMENGRIENVMEREHILGQMEMCTLENIIMILALFVVGDFLTKSVAKSLYCEQDGS